MGTVYIHIRTVIATFCRSSERITFFLCGAPPKLGVLSNRVGSQEGKRTGGLGSGARERRAEGV